MIGFGRSSPVPEILRSDDGAARVITMALKRGSEREHEGYEHGWVMVLDGER